MTGVGPTSQPSATQPDDGSPGPDGAAPEASELAESPAMARARRFTAANMIRSILPLVLICLVLVGWNAFRSSPDDPVREVDPTSTVQLAAARADYPVLAPAGLDEDFRPTSARTDAGDAGEGEPVTVEIGYLTPSEEFAGFVVSDDATARPLRDVLDGAEEEGTVELAGRSWTRATSERGETVLFHEDGEVTVLVTGSAPVEELKVVAAAVEPYSA